MSNKLKERLMARTANLADKVETAAAERPSIAEQRPMTMPGQLGAFRLEAKRYQEQIERLTQQLEDARKRGGAVDIPLGELHEVPGRRRYMPPGKYAELRENLRHNKLIHPVVVSPREGGGFEIVSGHHRTDAFRDLGRTDIRCVLEEITAAEATDGAFYANLMQSDLTDYEKYLGFKEIGVRNPKITQAQMAEKAGVPTSTVSKLMAFGQLPEAVLDLLSARPDLLGSTSGYALSSLAKEGRTAKVVAAVERLARGEIDQTQAVKMAASADPQPKPAKAAPVKIRAGRSVYCDMRAARNVLRIEFQSEDEVVAVQDELRKVLERRAEQVKAAASEEEKN